MFARARHAVAITSNLNYSYHKIMRKLPFSYYKGGTSRGIFFNKIDLPDDRSVWDEIFLKVLGLSRGTGTSFMGTDLPTRKICVISPSELEDTDIEYNFFQVDHEHGIVDNRGSCGNMASAAALFAIEEGLVATTGKENVIRIYNRNTRRVITSIVSAEKEICETSGTGTVNTPAGTDIMVELNFERPGGGFSGKLFPTGNQKDVLNLPAFGNLNVTIIDCVNPVIILRAEELGLLGHETSALQGMLPALERIETARGTAAQMLGLVEKWENARRDSAYIPHVVLASAPRSYEGLDGTVIAASQMDICCRAIFTGLHKAFPVGAATGVAAAAVLPGTILSEMLTNKIRAGHILIGHPSGVIDVGIDINRGDVVRASTARTARRLFDGHFYLD